MITQVIKKRLIPLLPYILIIAMAVFVFKHYTGIVSHNNELQNTIETMDTQINDLEFDVSYVKEKYAHQKEMNALRDSLNERLREMNTKVRKRNEDLEEELERIENENHITNTLNNDVVRLLNTQLEQRGLQESQ